MKTPRGGKLPVVEHRSLKLHHFQDFGQHIHFSLPHNAGKPFRTLEQVIIRQVRPGQESRTREQAPQESCAHSSYVESTEADHRWSIQNSNVPEDEVWKSFKGNQWGKP